MGNLVVTVRHGEVVELTLPNGERALVHLHDEQRSTRVRLRFEAPLSLGIRVRSEDDLEPEPTPPPPYEGKRVIVAAGQDVGMIVLEGGTPSPTIVCDGREYDPAEYPELKAVLRDRFGENRVPDLRAIAPASEPRR